jgi:C-terminal processing protease CtpA/Prc
MQIQQPIYSTPLPAVSQPPNLRVLPPRPADTVSNKRAYIGINAETCLDDRNTKGAYVVNFYPNSPASKAGIRVRDQIIKFAGKRINSADDVTTAISELPPGNVAVISVVRYESGKEESVAVVSVESVITERQRQVIHSPNTVNLCASINRRAIN